MIDVDRPSVVVLKRRTDRHIVKPIEVEIGHCCDGCAKPGAARLVFVRASGRAGGTTGLIDRLQSKLVPEPAVLVK